MSQRKRFRTAVAVILVLLMTVALAPAAAAQLPPPPSIPDDGGGGTTPEPPSPGPSPTPDPPGPVDPPVDPPPPPPTRDPGDGEENGMMAPSPASWPPPNAIVRHAATPVQVSAHGGALNVYFIARDGTATSGPVIASPGDLAAMHPDGAPVSLFSGTNPGTGKSVTIDYLPGEMKIRVSTFYADRPPHDFNKPYVFTIDADHSVTHVTW